METIDHAILIPATARAVWTLVSTPQNNPAWQADCDETSILTNNPRGQGARWRHSHRSGDMVLEITAWYEGLGYEYVIVDGVPYQNANRGRIRLQETPDGTVVQWTFSFDASGLFKGGRKRRIDKSIVNSLRSLYQFVKESGISEGTQHYASLMRDAPDVEQRSHYQPRYPTYEEMDEAAYQPPTGPQPAAPSNTPPAPKTADDARYRPPGMTPPQPMQPAQPSLRPQFEPPVADDDTRPNPSVRPEQAQPDDVPRAGQFTNREVINDEPSFLSDLTPSQRTTAERPSPQRFDDSRLDNSHLDESRFDRPATPPAETRRDEGRYDPLRVEPSSYERPKPPQPPADDADRPATQPSRSRQTGEEISIFERFGLKRPSETQEMAQSQPATDTPATPDVPQVNAQEQQPVTPSKPIDEPVNQTPTPQEPAQPAQTPPEETRMQEARPEQPARPKPTPEAPKSARQWPPDVRPQFDESQPQPAGAKRPDVEEPNREDDFALDQQPVATNQSNDWLKEDLFNEEDLFDNVLRMTDEPPAKKQQRIPPADEQDIASIDTPKPSATQQTDTAPSSQQSKPSQEDDLPDIFGNAQQKNDAPPSSLLDVIRAVEEGRFFDEEAAVVRPMPQDSPPSDKPSDKDETGGSSLAAQLAAEEPPQKGHDTTALFQAMSEMGLVEGLQGIQRADEVSEQKTPALAPHDEREAEAQAPLQAEAPPQAEATTPDPRWHEEPFTIDVLPDDPDYAGLRDRYRKYMARVRRRAP